MRPTPVTRTVQPNPRTESTTKPWTPAGAVGAIFSGLAFFLFLSPALPLFHSASPVPPPGELASKNPPATAMMALRARQAEAAGKRFRPRQTWVPLSRISPALVNAVIAAEDSTFYLHRGVEWGLTRDVLLSSLRTGRRDRGASTITQQVARNLYLSPRKTYVRKFREIVLAQRLERALSKKRILEIYLNVAEWGEGIFGAEAAAREYFGKSAADLTWEEAVRLTAVLPSPRRHRPTDDSGWVNSRAEWVWRRAVATGRWVPAAPVPPPPSRA